MPDSAAEELAWLVAFKRRIAEALAQHPDCPHRMPCCDMARALKGES